MLHTSRTNPRKMKAGRCRRTCRPSRRHDGGRRRHLRPDARSCSTTSSALGHRLPRPHRRRRHPELRADALTATGSRSSRSPRRWTTTSRGPSTASASRPRSRARRSSSTASGRPSARTSASACSASSAGTAGFTALYTAYVTSARCLIPEVPFDLDHLVPAPGRGPAAATRATTRSSIAAEGAIWKGGTHPGGRRGRRVRPPAQGEHRRGPRRRDPCPHGHETVSSELTYDLRSGEADALDQMVAITFANMAIDLIAEGTRGRMMASATASTPTCRCPTRRFPRGPSTWRRCTTRSASGRSTPAGSGSRSCSAPTCDRRRARRRRRRALRPRRRVSSAVEAGELPDRPGEGRVVVVAVALGDEPVLERRGEGGHRQRRADLARELERDPEVLAVERDAEAERVLVARSCGRSGSRGPSYRAAPPASAAATCSGSRPAFIASTIPSATAR